MSAKNYVKPLNERLQDAQTFLARKRDRAVEERTEASAAFLRPKDAASRKQSVTVELDPYELGPIRRKARARGVSVEQIITDILRRSS